MPRWLAPPFVEVNDPTTAGVADEDAGVDNLPDGPVPVLTAEEAGTSEMHGIFKSKGHKRVNSPLRFYRDIQN